MRGRSNCSKETGDEGEDPFRVPGVFVFVVCADVFAIEADDRNAEDELDEADEGDQHAHFVAALWGWAFERVVCAWHEAGGVFLHRVGLLGVLVV